MESRYSRAALPGRQAILRTEACYQRNHATNAIPAAPRTAAHGNHRAYRIPGYAAPRCVHRDSSRKISTTVAGSYVPVGRIAFGHDGIEKAAGFRPAAVGKLPPSCANLTT